jgi:glycosyltransferase involved in cell wall biosynthesis
MAAPHLASYAHYAERRAAEQPMDRAGQPAVSIITVTLNAVTTIEQALRSVHDQSFPSNEHILIDAQSTDGTPDVFRRFARPQDYWISEKDRGISDAFNKGIALARGSFIQILNADDWLSSDQIERGVAILEDTDADFVFGDVVFYDDGQIFFSAVGDPDYERVIESRMPSVDHATMLVRKAVYERFGLFDLSYRNAMDYDWLLRLHRAGGKGIYRSAVIAHRTHGGVSHLQFKRTIVEVKRIAIEHGRNRLLAETEAGIRYVKTSASQVVRRHSLPLYHLARRSINPSYRPPTR